MDNDTPLIPDDSIVPSSTEPGKDPSDIRLNGPDAWSPDESDTNPSITIELSQPTRVTGIIIQGGGPNNPNEYVTQFEVEYSPDGVNFYPVGINGLPIVSNVWNILYTFFFNQKPV